MSLNRPFKKYMGIMLLKNTSEKTERQKRLLLQVHSITAKYHLYKEHSSKQEVLYAVPESKKPNGI